MVTRGWIFRAVAGAVTDVFHHLPTVACLKFRGLGALACLVDRRSNGSLTTTY